MGAAKRHRFPRIRPIWIWLAAIAGSAEVGLGYLWLHPRPFETVPEQAARLAKQHGIEIGYGHPSRFYVPPFGPADADIADLRMVGAAPENLPQALDGIETSLSLYPPGFVHGLIQAIFIAGDMRDRSELAGGSTGPAWFILSAPDSFGSEGVRLTSLVGVHHELSSFVLRKTNVAEEWTRFAPTGWQFRMTNEEALAHGRDAAPSPETGFLSAYGATTPENDFNTYAEKIFTEPETLVALACKHALVRKKVLFVLHTYVALDARMENVFRELGVDEAHLCERRWRWPW